MTNYPYILFNKSPEQLRRLGARGGRAYGCNQRARRARMPKLPDAVVLRAAPRESTAEAIAVLDAQFPWLRDAEKRVFLQPAFPLAYTVRQFALRESQRPSWALTISDQTVNQKVAEPNPIRGAKYLPLRVHPHFRLTARSHVSAEMANIGGIGLS